MLKQRNILVVASGWYYGQSDANDGKFQYFSEWYTHSLAVRTDKRHLRKTRTQYQLLHGFFQPQWMRKFPVVSKLVFFAATISYFGLLRRQKDRFDVVIARDPLSSGLVCLALSKILCIPMIVELNGNFASPHVWKTATRKLRWVRRFIGLRVAKFVLSRAAAVKQLYPGQRTALDNSISSASDFVFHEFVALGADISTTCARKNYLLAMGSPWYIKGIDVLVRAYNEVISRDPNYSLDLRVVGWIPDDDMANLRLACDLSDPRIQFSPPVPYEAGQRLIAEAAAVIMASRTEAMGRVLIEAMSYGVMCIGSTADGIPHYLDDGKTGLIFESEEFEQLAELLRRIESEDFEAIRMRAKVVARKEYSGEEFARRYEAMIDSVIPRQ